MRNINSIEVLKSLSHKEVKKSLAWIDVRSEGEFEEGYIPGFSNFPILNNIERAEVGTCFKQQGQEKAIELGHALVKDSKKLRVDSWVAQTLSSSQQTAIVTCWRGGLRSKTACDWLEEQNVKTMRVIGGYKALRATLLDQLLNLPKFIVISGLTGSGKTSLIKKFETHAVDLEQHAHHRGSTFGMHSFGEQPKQSTFENRVLFDFYSKDQELLIEDESIRIGQVQIPKILKSRMIESPAIWLESKTEDRVTSIVNEYVIDGVNAGVEPEAIYKKLDFALNLLRKKLGPVLTAELQVELKKAFTNDLLDFSAHERWVEPLLTRHYDKLYEYSFKKNPRTVIFRGDQKECEQWIQSRFG